MFIKHGYEFDRHNRKETSHGHSLTDCDYRQVSKRVEKTKKTKKKTRTAWSISPCRPFQSDYIAISISMNINLQTDHIKAYLSLTHTSYKLMRLPLVWTVVRSLTTPTSVFVHLADGISAPYWPCGIYIPSRAKTRSTYAR